MTMDYVVCFVALLSVLKTTTVAVGGSNSQWLTDKFLLVADTTLNMILQFDLTTHSSTYNISFDTATHPKALAFDPLNRTVYWTSGTVASVYRHHTDSGQKEVFFSSADGSSYGGLAIDDKARKLYLTDEGNGMVLELPLDVTDVRHRIIDSDRWSKPRGIVVDSFNRLLYWTDWRHECAAIYRANITDGVKTAVFTRKDLRKPQALAINFENQRLYWIDNNLVPYSVGINGSLRTISRPNEPTESFGLAVSSSYIYVSDWQSKQLVILTHTGDVVNNILLAQPSGIVVHSSTDAALTNTGEYDIPKLGRQPGSVCSSTTVQLETSTAEMPASDAHPFGWITIAAAAGGCFLLLVTCIILIKCYISRSKRRTSTCDSPAGSYYDDARTIPQRYSEFTKTSLPASVPPPLPPIRSQLQDDKNEDYLEPTFVVTRNGSEQAVHLGGDVAYYNTEDEYTTLNRRRGGGQPSASAVGETYDRLRRSRMLTSTTPTVDGKAPYLSLYDDCASVCPNSGN